jgi:hypothetical protein
VASRLAFDLRREAIVLVAADKSGVSQKKFYKRLIEKADERYARHIATLKPGGKAAAARNTSSTAARK